MWNQTLIRRWWDHHRAAPVWEFCQDRWVRIDGSDEPCPSCGYTVAGQECGEGCLAKTPGTHRASTSED